jgi:hypothetical protein
MTQAGNELAEVLGLDFTKRQLEASLQRSREIKPVALKLLAELQSLRWFNPSLTAVHEPIDLTLASRELRELVDTADEQILHVIRRIENLSPEYLDDIGAPRGRR